MFSKYLTVVVVPRKTSKVRKIKIPLHLFVLGAVLVVGLVSGLTYVAIDYFHIRSQLANLETLQDEYLKQEKEIEAFSNRYESSQVHYDNLLSLNHKLKSMVMTTMSAEKKAQTKRVSEEELAAMAAIAEKQGIMQVIDSDASEVDSDLKHERALKFQNLVKFYQQRQNPFSRIPHLKPVNGFLIDEFGLHTDPFTGQMRPQNGIDIASRLDFEIYAPADGIVIEIKEEENYGNVLVLDHGNGIVTRYGHISQVEVEEGEIVRKGGVIALVGNTGRTTGPRLYYEVILNRIPQNPVKYINN